MKLILSTSNIMASGQSVVRRPLFSKSNIELINALRSNFASSQHQHQHHHHSTATSSTTNSTDATSNSTPASSTPTGTEYTQWTTQDGDTLYVPTWRPTPLTEPRDSYDVTAKLFYLPGIPSSRRCKHTREAIDLVLKELGVESIDLLIVSYPGVSFDADDYGDDEEEEDQEEGTSSPSVNHDDASANSITNGESEEGLDAQIKAWRVLESLHEKGVISQLGVSEFSSERLAKFLPEVKVRPTVDQINVKDCCVVPKPLIVYAKENKIDLLTHADCTDILPPGTTRELLGPQNGGAGAGLIAARPEAGPEEAGLKGDIEPQWVIKYTAVVKNRGVIENKGYFAVAQLGTCIEEDEKQQQPPPQQELQQNQQQLLQQLQLQQQLDQQRQQQQLKLQQQQLELQQQQLQLQQQQLQLQQQQLELQQQNINCSLSPNPSPSINR